MQLTPYTISPDNAEKIAGWLNTRGGVAVWLSEDLTRPGETLLTPVKQSGSDEPMPKPVWWVGDQPACVITDPADVIVSADVEVKRLHVAFRSGNTGPMVKCTAASGHRVREAVNKAGDGAYFVFDYAAREAVIMKPESQVSLPTWLETAKVKV